MKKITLLLATLLIVGLANAQIPNLTFGQTEFYPQGALDGSPGSVFDPQNMYSIGTNTTFSQIDYTASVALQTPGDIVLAPGGSALIEIHLPPFVRDYTISMDGSVLAAGNPTIRVTHLGEDSVGSTTPQSYISGTIPDNDWAFVYSANRNYNTIRNPNYATVPSVARIIIYNGQNFGYTTPTDYTGSINVDQISVHWFIAQADSMNYVNWANGITTGIDDVDASSISIYPNPTTNYLNISGYGRNTSIRIFDLTGKTILAQQLTSNKIDVNDLTKGVYFIEVKSNNSIKTIKFLKQ